MNNSSELQLAGEISNCSRRIDALTNSTSPCHKVVTNQFNVTSDFKDFHRPEPWIGRISTSKLLFISSNPGLSVDQGAEREIFPIENWSVGDSADFFVERFNREHDPVYATFNNDSEPNFLTRSFDGEYRSGGKNPKTPQKTWAGIYKLAGELLGSNCSPDGDYALTEIVHCKSLMAAGVTEASNVCASQWMPKITSLAPAKVLILLGSKVRDNFALPFLGAPSDFAASNGAKYRSMSENERSLRDIFVTAYGGQNRLGIFNFHPTSMEIRGMKNVYGEKVVDWVQGVIAGSEHIPSNNSELRDKILSL
jgi:hypothetical protein